MTFDPTILDMLKIIDIFKPFCHDNDFFQELSHILHIRNISGKEYVIKEGEMGEEMFILIKGSVEITKKTPAGDEYAMVVLTEKNTPFFGELALLDADKRSASVRTVNDSRFVAIKKSEFIDFCDKFPSWGVVLLRQISTILTQRLRKTSADMGTLYHALLTEIGS